jgi:hypothetical protein
MEEDNAPVVVPACGNIAVLVSYTLRRTESQRHDMHTGKTAYISTAVVARAVLVNLLARSHVKIRDHPSVAQWRYVSLVAG